MAREPEGKVRVRTLTLSEHPRDSTHTLYVSGQVATLLRFEQDVDAARTKLLGWEGRFTPLLVGSRKVVIEPLRDLGRDEGVPLLVTLADGTEVTAYSVVIATGMSARTLDVPGLERFQGVGVYYGAAMTEAARYKGKDICVLGGGVLARSLFEADLIDEVGINIHPVLLGSGIPLFHEMKKQINLKLIKCQELKNGCVVLKYKVSHKKGHKEAQTPQKVLSKIIPLCAFLRAVDYDEQLLWVALGKLWLSIRRMRLRAARS